jgi:hypothetical protein
MSVVTCPGPGGPVTFSPPTYVIRHVRGGRTWPCPSLRPGHNQGTIPRPDFDPRGWLARLPPMDLFGALLAAAHERIYTHSLPL